MNMPKLEPILFNKILFFALFVGIQAVPLNAEIFHISCVNAGLGVAGNIKCYYVLNGNALGNSIGQPGINNPGTTNLINWDDTFGSIGTHQQVVIYLDWYEYASSQWYHGSSCPYTQGTGGSVTLYIFPGGVNTNIYNPPPIDPDDDGSSPSDNGGGESGSQNQQCDSQCSSCSGMPVWWVSQPYTSLWLRDEPLGYQPAVGSRISFKLTFKQREAAAGYNTNFFSVGKKWNCSWLSFVARDTNANNVVYFPGGGQRTFYTTNDYLTNARLAGNTNSGFTLSYPDGSQYVYGFIINNSSGNFQEAFLTQTLNAKGQKTTFNYSNYTNTSPVIRLQSVIDGDGRTTLIYYNSTNSYSTNLISQVADPLGRKSLLAYDDNGHLTNITDVVTNFSALTYDNNDWVNSLTTPYGTTSFAITGSSGTNFAPEGRSVLVTQPDGGHQLYLYTNNAPGIASSYATNQIPTTTPFANTFDTNDLNLRNSFYWGPRQYASLSTTNISSFSANDFSKAWMRHWLIQNSRINLNSPGRTLSIERDASPDNGGTIGGQITWYDYAGKPNSGSEYEGAQIMPFFVARVLPDGSTWFKRTACNLFGAVTNEVSTYSVGGGVLLRTNTYKYDSNGIDLLVTTNVLGVQVSSNAYNANHEILASYNALREKTTYTYDSSNRLTSITSPTGLVTTNIYGADNFLAQQIDICFATNSYTYSNDLVLTHTDQRGLTTTNTWDSLNRLTSTAFPDGTAISYTYTNLDLIRVVDRMGFTNSFGYDSMRRKIAETNALGRVTLYSYCTCGLLDSILGAANNLTQFFYDNQGNLTNTLYADNYSVTRTLNLLNQVVSTTDSSGYSVTNTYNNQGLLISVSNAFGRVQSTVYDPLDRATNSVDANGVSINKTYDNLNRPLTRSYPDNGVGKWGYTLNVFGATSYTNQIGNAVLYGFDAMNRKTNEVYVGVTTNQFAYKGAGDLLTLNDGKNQTTTWGYDSYGRVTNKVDAANNLLFVYKYDPDNRLTNRWSTAKGNTVYTYDSIGNLTHVAYPVSPSISLAYDVLNHLTNIVDAVGTTAYSYDQVGQILSEDGPWANDTVSYTYQNRLRMGLSVQAPNASAWMEGYTYDTVRRLKTVSSPAGAFNYTLGAASSTSPLIKKLLLPNGAFITNSYDGNARLLNTVLKNSGGTNLDSYTYIYNAGNQRTNVVRTAGDSVSYTYDNEGELKTAIGREAGGVTNRLQEQLGYVYDAAGNLNQRTNNALVQNFGVNNLNELSTMTRSGTLTVAGTTTSPATNVTVNSLAANIYGDATFALGGFSLVDGNNSFTAIAQDSYGRRDTNSITVNLPATNVFAYDLNGNMITNGTQLLDYDDENELIRITVANAWKTEFTYDGKFRRRIRKEFTWQSGSWVQTNEVHYIWDGNVVIQERDANNLPLVTYTRGNDLSGTLQGAGGIGGLLARTDNGQLIAGSSFATALYHADGNGNITALIYTNQLFAAKYLYDPFGNILSMSGPLVPANTYRFSSMEYYEKADMLLYLYRPYFVSLQRWPNRDPIGEAGGINLYDYVGNNPVNFYDPLGLWTFQVGFTFGFNWGWGNFFVSAGITGDTKGNINTYTTGGAGAALEAGAIFGVTVQVSNAKCNQDLSGRFGYGSAGGGFGPAGSGDAFWGNSPDGPVFGLGGTFGVGADAGVNGGLSYTTIRPLWP